MEEADNLLENREPVLEDVIIDNEILLAEVDHFMKKNDEDQGSDS